MSSVTPRFWYVWSLESRDWVAKSHFALLYLLLLCQMSNELGSETGLEWPADEMIAGASTVVLEDGVVVVSEGGRGMSFTFEPCLLLSCALC
jgi:hypothetical protein